MPLPQPKTPLNNACSVIFDNTLYTYSADAFQSLQLKPGAKWKVLPQGEKVKGAACVGSTTGTASTSAFFVVGGVGGTDEYQGLQKFTYSTGQWESVKLLDKVTHQRVGHSAVYLNSTDSILIYAGNQDGSNGPSTSTFTIGASAPHEVRSYDTSGPPSVNPILLSWSPSEAALIGGSTWNAQVMLFNAADKKWVDSGASLAAPLPKDTSAIQAVLMTGDDGSKNLLTFDMSESPNAVRRTVLFKGPGVPVPNAAPVRKRASSRRGERGLSSKEKRAGEPLTVNNWPAYNSTSAPKVTRSNFALAQGPDGMVVMAGGTAADDVLCMFDARSNSWEDAESKLSQVRLLSTESSTTRSSSTSSGTATSTRLSSTSTSLPSTTSLAASATNPIATQTPTEAAAAAVPNGSDPQLNTILGAVLGSIFGVAILLVLVYVCIRRRKRQSHMESGHVSRASGPAPSEKDSIGFAKETLAFGGSPPAFRGHQQQGSQSSFSSMAILMGRAGEKSAPTRPGRKGSNESRRDSSDSTFKAFKSTISKPMAQPTPPPAAARPPPPSQQTRDEKGVAFAASTVDAKPRTLTAGADKQGDTRRSSGWNRYWSGGSALNLLGFGNGNNNNLNSNLNSNNNLNNINSSNAAAARNSQRATLVSERSSHYSNPHRMTQDSATVPPLFPASAEPRMSFSRVNAHSPTIAVYNDKLNQGMSGSIETQRPISAVSDMSASAYSSGIPESVQDAWDAAAAGKPWGADRSHNDSSTGVYSTPLAPASQGLKPPSQGPPRRNQPPVRDDMSWLNLGGN